jgi:hypothetical protein
LRWPTRDTLSGWWPRGRRWSAASTWSCMSAAIWTPHRTTEISRGTGTPALRRRSRMPRAC